MHASSLQRHNIVFLIVALTLIFSLSYFRYTGYRPETPPVNDFSLPTSTRPSTPHRYSSSSLPPPPKFEGNSSATPVCNKVDFDWLASDRLHWDGWTSKAMFMRPDGLYTSNDITITAGENICVVVVLGPIPAVSAIRPEIHFAPADSITIHAVGDMIKVPITLEQHERQGNIYYSSVHFTHADVYVLKSTTQYRSYFWETPIYHPYRPFGYTSHNSLVVNEVSGTIEKPPLPSCNGHISTGSWINKTEYQRLRPLDFYDMFGDAQEDHAADDLLFVPDQCRMDYISTSQAIQCLEGKTIHIWGDNNIKRNLKAFNTPSWCGSDSTDTRCICNDDFDDDNWGTDDINAPLMITDTWHNDIRVDFNPIGSITLRDLRETIRERASQLPRADLVMISVGNDDITLSRMTPIQFWHSFTDLMAFLVDEVYPEQTIIVRTPQYFSGGTVYGTSWNSGRSRAFATVVRQAVKQLQRPNILLWDIHRLGVEDNTCVGSGSAYTKRNVVNIENLLLWNLICSSS
ncbi:hypothetical protein BJV82DRAFT_672553 [Fennellomyces sp. T-0311]|nr:hypothetical protein BJV82DRAFT_672553 [Fennellomyces sp. T-0311]